MKGRLNPNTKITMTVKEREQMKTRAHEKGLNDALNITNMLPLIALRDEYGFGHKRMHRYMERYQNTLDAFFKDYLTLEDIAEVMEEEVKIDVREWFR